MKKENKILDKIRKLFQVTIENGATEGEVENALKMAQQLMMRHNIDENEILLSPLDIDITYVENQYKSNEPKYWFWDLLITIGKCYSCEVTQVTIGGKKVYKIIGTNTDREIVKEIFDKILPILRNLNNIRYKEYVAKKRNDLGIQKGDYPLDFLVRYRHIISKSVFTGSYIKGFLSGLSSRLQNDQDEFLKLDSDKEKWGLIVIKKDDLIADYLKELNPKMVKIRGQKDFNIEAYLLGNDDGSEENTKEQLHC